MAAYPPPVVAGLQAQGVRGPLPTLSALHHPDAHDARAGACLLVTQRGPVVARGARRGVVAQGQARVKRMRLAARALGRVACKHSVSVEYLEGTSRHRAARVYYQGIV